MGIGETVTVINKSGKVVSNSKHFVSIFKEAKASYRERKAELKAERDAAAREKRLIDGMNNIRIGDDERSRGARSQRHHNRPALQHSHTDSQVNTRDRFAHGHEITRRGSNTHVATRSHPADDDLCYGDVPPPLEEPRHNNVEMEEKAWKIEMLLEEADCLQYSASNAIESLQRNPEALAAVSLTLAELSALVAKMGPGVLTSLKCSFPAVAALLLSPQFLIASGVAVGVTIVALGGFKIIKKIQADQEAERNAVPVTLPITNRAPVQRIEAQVDLNDLDELQPQELSRVEKWRRGIADVVAESGGTTVDGEFVTPGASKQLVAAGVLDEDDLKSRRSLRLREDGERRRSHRAKSERSVRGERGERGEKTGHTSRHKSGNSKGKAGETRKSKSPKEGSTTSTTKKKEKEPSGFRMLFRSHTST